MPRLDPRVGAPLTLLGGGLLLYAALIASAFLGGIETERPGAWLLMINAGVALAILALGRLRPVAVFAALAALVVGQVLIIATLIRNGVGMPAIVVAVQVVLGAPFLVGLVLASMLLRARRREADAAAQGDESERQP